MSIIRTILFFGLIVLGLMVLVVHILPTPRQWEPAPYTASHLFDFRQFDFHDSLQNATLIEMPGPGPEDIVIDSKGMIYTGSWNGSIYQIDPSTKIITKLAGTHGRVLGLDLDEEEKRIGFVDLGGGVGILNLETKKTQYYATQLKHESMNSLTFVSKNKIYLTVTGKIPMEAFHEELFYRNSLGSIYEVDLVENSTKLWLGGLAFPNGIDYDPITYSFYVNQLSNYRVLRIPLDPKLNKSYTVVFDNLMGFPDNIKVMKDGTLWVGLPMLRNYLTDLIDHSQFIRKLMILMNFSPMVYKSIGRIDYVGGIRIDPSTGEIVEYLQGEWGRIKFVTTINEKNGVRVLGSSRNILIALLPKQHH